MELKHNKKKLSELKDSDVLIIPCGIETLYLPSTYHFQSVLIVPSGIEATIALKISVDTNALIAPLLYKQIKETITIFCFFID